MILPGQSRHASRKITETIAEIESGLGLKIQFLSLNRIDDSTIRDRVRGYHDRSGGMERIWLDPRLPYTAQEALAAHELAHVVQRNKGYPHAASLIPTLEQMAARINNLVMDESADLWAIGRGFDMSKALSHIGLDELIKGLNQKAVETEASDWKKYYASIEKLAGEVNKTRTRHAPVIGAEAGTQIMALDYAGLSRRLERFGLFGGLDATWEEHWPISRRMGKELSAIVSANGVGNGEECRRTLEKIIGFLKIPAQLMSIG
jgi:hypothetical protein